MEPNEQLAEMVKVSACAKSLGVTTREFPRLCAEKQIPVLRPSERRQRLLKEHFEILCRLVADPAERRVAC